MPTDLDTLAAKVAELLDKPRKRKDKRRCIQARLNPDEWQTVNATCLAKGVCLADLIRLGLQSVCGSEFPINRNTPPELRRFAVRHKPDHFVDEKTSIPERDRATARNATARRAIAAAYEHREAMQELGAATHAQNMPGMIDDSPSPLLSGKPSR